MSGGLHCATTSKGATLGLFFCEMNSLSKKRERVLTLREREILRLIVQGRSNRQIAAELKLSEHGATASSQYYGGGWHSQEHSAGCVRDRNRAGCSSWEWGVGIATW